MTGTLYLVPNALDFGVSESGLGDLQQVLPLGVSDIAQKHNVKVFCPKCCDLYSPRSRRRSARSCRRTSWTSGAGRQDGNRCSTARA